MRGSVAEVVAISGLAAVVTLGIAVPVLRAPSERVFGMAIVGRHHDPFTVMAQLERPITVGVYTQPVTDIPGALLARRFGGVAAYNWLVLLSFPFAAATAYLLGRHLGLAPPGAGVAAMLYAFSPFHVAHAAYHPHVAQVQWLPLYLLALWRCLDRVSPHAVGLLGAATLGVTLSNFYGGLIAGVMTPVAVAAYTAVTWRHGPGTLRRLGLTLASLAVLGAAGIAYAWSAAGPVLAHPMAFAFPRADLLRYSATWWSYLLPPAHHPVFGDAAHRLWMANGIGVGLLEQQLGLGWAVIGLGLIAAWHWIVERRRGSAQGPLLYVPALLVIGATAFVCSLPPDWSIGAFTIARPSAVLYDILPMFRAYARFGVVVHFMAALLAGIGVECLRRAGPRFARVVCVALIAIAVGEYAVAPQAMWRDVLPTMAHRWVMRNPDTVRALDCTPAGQESASVEWLTGYRIRLLPAASECDVPRLTETLPATGYTHLLIRRDSRRGRAAADDQALDAWSVDARFDDGQVFTVPPPTLAIRTTATRGFYPREHDAHWTWRWMGREATWTIANSSAGPVDATLDIELSAFHGTRPMGIRLDGRPVQTVVADTERRTYSFGPLTIAPGQHELVFYSVGATTVADTLLHNGDPRRLSFAIGVWRWGVSEVHP